MTPLRREKNNCFCAFCKSPRRIYRKKNIGAVNLVAGALASVVVMFALWQQFDPRVLIVFVVCLAFSEVFIKVRWRLSIPCSQCGFDPVLYLRNPGAAAEKVKLRLDARKQDPHYLLSKPLDLPKISASKAKALHNKNEKGQLVSRRL